MTPMVYILAINLYFPPHSLFPGQLIFHENSVIFWLNCDFLEFFLVKIEKIKAFREKIRKIWVAMGKTRWKSFNWRVKSPNIDKNSGMSNLNFSLTGKIPYLSPLPPIPKVGPRDPKKGPKWG